MDDLSAIMSSLDQVNYFLQRRPSSKIETGVLPDSPVYGQETRALEQIQSELSLAIKGLQRQGKSDDPNLIQARLYAKKLEREMKASLERADSVNVHELLAATIEKIHEYHEATELPIELRQITETPQYYGYSNADLHPSLGGSIEAFVALFSIISAYVQLRRRRNR